MELKKHGHQIIEVEISTLEIDNLTNINPLMTDADFEELKLSLREVGYDKNFPILLYKKKIVDGRHRFLACNELSINKLWARHLPQNMTRIEVEELVMRTDNRRHKTPTQKAIGAYRYYLKRIKSGNKISQEAAARKLGTSKLMMSRVPKLEAIAGSIKVDALFNGNKINIKNKNNKPFPTDSLLTLIGYYNNNTESDITGFSKHSDEFSDDEIDRIQSTFNELTLSFSTNMLKLLNSQLWSEINNRKKL